MTDGPRCADCHQPIRTAASLALGYGPKCARDLGLIPPRRPRTTRPAPAEPDQHHPGQTAIPIQMEITT